MSFRHVRNLSESFKEGFRTSRNDRQTKKQDFTHRLLLVLQGEETMADRRYKYVREDFGELPVKLHHLTIYLNFAGDYVEATNCLEMTALQELPDAPA